MAQAAQLSFCPEGQYIPTLDPNRRAVDYIDNGYCALLAQCEQDPIQRIINRIKNYMNKAAAILAVAGNISEEIDIVAGVIKNLGSQLVTGLVNKLMERLKELMEQGISSLLAANPLAIDEILGLEGPVDALSKGAICVINKIGNGLKDSAAELLGGIASNVENFATCAAEQFVGGFLNNIIDQVVDGIKPLLEPLEKIIPKAFDILDFLMSAVDAISAVKEFLSCGEQKECPTVNGFFVGGDICNEDKPSFSSILKGASLARGAQNLANDALKKFGDWGILGGSGGGCYTGPPLSCGTPEVSIIGGGGSGAVAKAILGNVVKNTAGLSNVVDKVGSVVGIEIIDPGSGYTSTPFVSITDSCNLGYGGYAKANVDFNTGRLSSIVVRSSGVNYPIDKETPLGVAGAVIEDGGFNYGDNDTLDGFDLTVENGRIISAELSAVIPTDGDIKLKVNTETGSGAIIRPIINSLPVVERTLQSSIDCIE